MGDERRVAMVRLERCATRCIVQPAVHSCDPHCGGATHWPVQAGGGVRCGGGAGARRALRVPQARHEAGHRAAAAGADGRGRHQGDARGPQVRHRERGTCACRCCACRPTPPRAQVVRCHAEHAFPAALRWSSTQLEVIKAQRGGGSVDDGTMAPLKPLAEVLREAKEKKEQDFADKWKMMKTGARRCLETRTARLSPAGP